MDHVLGRVEDSRSWSASRRCSRKSPGSISIAGVSRWRGDRRRRRFRRSPRRAPARARAREQSRQRGRLFRVALALGADGVLLDPASADPLYRKAVRTSMGAALRVPFARVDPWPAALDAIRTGAHVVALTPDPAAMSLAEYAVEPGCRVILLRGIGGTWPVRRGDALRRRAVRIPIARGGFAERRGAAAIACTRCAPASSRRWDCTVPRLRTSRLQSSCGFRL
jgi:hypothetical protein